MESAVISLYVIGCAVVNRAFKAEWDNDIVASRGLNRNNANRLLRYFVRKELSPYFRKAYFANQMRTKNSLTFLPNSHLAAE